MCKNSPGSIFTSSNNNKNIYTMNNSFICTKTNSTYTRHDFSAKGQNYCCLVVKGYFNYINITKISNNPHRTLGKDFKTFDEAQKHYKCPEIKLQLLNIELFQ